MKIIKKSVTLILCIIFGCSFVGCGAIMQNNKQDVEAALDEYFNACNMLDFEAVHNASYPEGMEGPISSVLLSDSEYEVFCFWKSDMGFARSRVDNADWSKFIPDFVVYEEYPFVYQDDDGGLVDRDFNEITMEEALPEFAVTYEIEQMGRFENVSVSQRNGLQFIELDNMDEIVTLADGSHLDVNDMYVAQISIEWSYKNNLYGYNKDWWKDDTFCEYNELTYNEIIKEYADYDYIVFVYQYDGEWYVYPEKMSAGVISYQAEF